MPQGERDKNFRRLDCPLPQHGPIRPVDLPAKQLGCHCTPPNIATCLTHQGKTGCPGRRRDVLFACVSQTRGMTAIAFMLNITTCPTCGSERIRKVRLYAVPSVASPQPECLSSVEQTCCLLRLARALRSGSRGSGPCSGHHRHLNALPFIQSPTDAAAVVSQVFKSRARLSSCVIRFTIDSNDLLTS